jgi:methylase of polypeptide subunit release factors
MSMEALPVPRFSKRYDSLPEEKVAGATYTPALLADFVAREMLKDAELGDKKGTLRVLDPAVGEGELLASLLSHLPKSRSVEVYGFDHDERALRVTRERLSSSFPKATLHLERRDFLEYVAGASGLGGLPLFGSSKPATFDLVIANPPYVRTQIMGAAQAQALANTFGLTGRVDLYHAFLLAIAAVLRPHGVAGLIVSNRFMTTKGGASVRQAVQERFCIKHVWDLGDTKLFNAAVLPAVLVAEGRNGQAPSQPRFSSIYETKDGPTVKAASPIDALDVDGVVEVADGRRFRVQHGLLDKTSSSDDIWRIATKAGDAWLATVESNAWGTFRSIGKVRVGVKTCADKVFIRNDWDTLGEAVPELLRPLTTHHIGRRFRANPELGQRQILYPHETKSGKRQVVDLTKYPKSRAYLEEHRAALEARGYVLEAGRAWYEIWVPQDPAAWAAPKLVFRDISEEPCFWLDLDGSVVNGDCYWLVCDGDAHEDLLWLAVSVGNSKFIEAFYDHRFNNKLYAGRRRFITQYVEKFPLPNPKTPVSKEIVRAAKELYASVDGPKAAALSRKIDELVWRAFGLEVEEVAR